MKEIEDVSQSKCTETDSLTFQELEARANRLIEEGRMPSLDEVINAIKIGVESACQHSGGKEPTDDDQGHDDGTKCPFCGWQIHGCEFEGDCEHHLTNIDTSEADGDYIYSGMGGAFDRSEAVAIGALNEVIDAFLESGETDAQWVEKLQPDRLRNLMKAVLDNAAENEGERDSSADLSALTDYLCQVCNDTGVEVRYTCWDNNNYFCSSSYLDIWAKDAKATVKGAGNLMAEDLERLKEAVKAAGKNE